MSPRDEANKLCSEFNVAKLIALTCVNHKDKALKHRQKTVYLTTNHIYVIPIKNKLKPNWFQEKASEKQPFITGFEIEPSTDSKESVEFHQR